MDDYKIVWNDGEDEVAPDLETAYIWVNHPTSAQYLPATIFKYSLIEVETIERPV
jgi:hypothetical protein